MMPHLHKRGDRSLEAINIVLEEVLQISEQWSPLYNLQSDSAKGDWLVKRTMNYLGLSAGNVFWDRKDPRASEYG
jgi:hypothetical protein